jgi:acetyl esterase/lipase
MRSLTSRLAVLILRLRRDKRRYSSAARLRESVARDRAAGTVLPRYAARSGVEATLDATRSRPVYTVRPRSPGRAHVLYLHGGGYIHGATRHHWAFAGKLARELAATVTVPLYPLAPERDASHAFEFALSVYQDLLRTVAPEDLILAGDSAGAGLALALLQLAREHALPSPSRVVLVSPWLDVELPDAAVASLERLDPMISAPGLREAGRWYAGALGTRDPRVSPVHMDLHGLPPTMLFMGTHDILLPDARRFRARARQTGAPLQYFEYPGMFHDWVLTVLPEARRAFAQLTKN